MQTVYGYGYVGIINSIKTTNGDYLYMSSDTSCWTSAGSLDINGMGSCQNSDIFLNGNRFRSYQQC